MADDFTMEVHVRTVHGVVGLAYAVAWCFYRIGRAEFGFRLAELILRLGSQMRIANERRWRSLL